MAEVRDGAPHLLILGGTAEAVALAAALAPDMAVTYSLAGRTAAPSLPEGAALRTGGFGGAAALADWIAAHGVTALVDATHPFAAGIAANAAQASDKAGIPRLKLVRPPWTARDGDDWRDVADIAAAASLLPNVGKSAFLSIGRQELAAFAGLAGMRFLVRTVDPLAVTPLDGAVCIAGRGPFAADDEATLLRAHEIDVLVSKNAGGAASYGKIAAARTLGLPVIMVARPPAPDGETADTIDAARDWALAQANRRNI